MTELHAGDVTFCQTFNKIGYTESNDQVSAVFRPQKGKKFAVLLLGSVDKAATDFDAEAALNRLGFYRKEMS